jgi:hypothetical protein
MTHLISTGRKLAAVFSCGLIALAIGCARPSDSAQVCDGKCGDDCCHDHGSTVAKTHTHDSWWCDEHGVPEEVCGQCNPKLAADFQKKGDWCADHDRPDSQCFVCHPELKAKFAAKYEARLGTLPPEPRF